MHLFSFLLFAVHLATAISAADQNQPPKASLLSNSIEEVRAHLRQELSAEERAAYRGITLAGMTGTKFERLIAVNTPEELILSEWYGKQFIPADEPQSVYLVSVGRGLTAQFHPDWVARMFQDKGPPPPSNKTKSEMDAEYRNYLSPFLDNEEEGDPEEILNGVASSYLTWVEDRSGRSGLQKRQQGYYCRSQRQVCGQTRDCARVKTIQRKMCNCGIYDTCVTDELPLPPYPCNVRCVGISSGGSSEEE